MAQKQRLQQEENSNHLIQQTNGYKLEFALECYEIQGTLIVYFLGPPAGSFENYTTANTPTTPGKSVMFSSPTASTRKKVTVNTPTGTNNTNSNTTSSQELGRHCYFFFYYDYVFNCICIVFALLHRISTTNGSVFITHKPCINSSYL